jgi:hypothetical protein
MSRLNAVHHLHQQRNIGATARRRPRTGAASKKVDLDMRSAFDVGEHGLAG